MQSSDEDTRSLQLISSSVETCSLPDSRKLASVFLHVFWQSNLQRNVKCACTNTAAAQRNTSARGVASWYGGKCHRVAACTWNSKKSVQYVCSYGKVSTVTESQCASTGVWDSATVGGNVACSTLLTQLTVAAGSMWTNTESTALPRCSKSLMIS